MVCGQCGTRATNPQARNCSQCGSALPQSYVALQRGVLVAGQYRVVKPIGEGGAGSIYLAEDQRTFNRRCVLKRLHAIHDPALRQRFVSEVQTLIGLRHPNIPQVYAYFEEGPTIYIVMEYIAGRDLEHGLSETLADGTFLPGRARTLAQVLQDGITITKMLEHLHSRTPPVVHCDIKPANIIRDGESGELFLVDFGAAAVAGTGENFGTPGYAAPEMYRGLRYPASDIYSLAATMYHMLTDDDPRDHPMQFPKLVELPPAVIRLLERALAKEPQERPDAATFRMAAERCLNPPEIGVVLKTPNGTLIQSPRQFVGAAQKHWHWAVGELVDGKLQRWLQEKGYTEDWAWMAQSRRFERPERTLTQYLRRIEPNLPPTEVRLAQQVIDLPDSALYSAHPFYLTAKGGTAHVAIASAPSWLQVGPPRLLLQPDDSAALQLAVDPDRLPGPKAREPLVLLIDIGEKEPQRITIPVSIGLTSSKVKQRGLPSSIIWMVFGVVLAIAVSGFLALAYPGAQALTIHLGVGGMIGSLYAWLFAHTKSEALGQIIIAVVVAGIAQVGMMIWTGVTGDYATINPLSLLIAAGAVVLINGSFTLIKSVV